MNTGGNATTKNRKCAESWKPYIFPRGLEISRNCMCAMKLIYRVFRDQSLYESGLNRFVELESRFVDAAKTAENSRIENEHAHDQNQDQDQELAWCVLMNDLADAMNSFGALNIKDVVDVHTYTFGIISSSHRQQPRKKTKSTYELFMETDAVFETLCQCFSPIVRCCVYSSNHGSRTMITGGNGGGGGGGNCGDENKIHGPKSAPTKSRKKNVVQCHPWMRSLPTSHSKRDRTVFVAHKNPNHQEDEEEEEDEEDDDEENEDDNDESVANEKRKQKATTPSPVLVKMKKIHPHPQKPEEAFFVNENGLRAVFYLFDPQLVLVVDGFVANEYGMSASIRSTLERTVAARVQNTVLDPDCTRKTLESQPEYGCNKTKTRWMQDRIATFSVRDALVFLTISSTSVTHYISELDVEFTELQKNLDLMETRNAEENLAWFLQKLDATSRRNLLKNLAVLVFLAEPKEEPAALRFVKMYAAFMSSAFSSQELTAELQNLYESFSEMHQLNWSRTVSSELQLSSSSSSSSGSVAAAPAAPAPSTTTTTLSNLDVLSYRERIKIVLATSPSARDKAMVKLREFSAKPDETNVKPRQYLDALLRIPFGVFREEPILCGARAVKQRFSEFIARHHHHEQGIPGNVRAAKKRNTLAEIHTELAELQSRWKQSQIEYWQDRDRDLSCVSSKQLDAWWTSICDTSVAAAATTATTATASSWTKLCKGDKLSLIAETLVSSDPAADRFLDRVLGLTTTNVAFPVPICRESFAIQKMLRDVNEDVNFIEAKMEKVIHGHQNAKQKIVQVIGQWMNGTQKGYCLGFEGSPGIGKTSLAKRGIAECLRDENGEYRPFAFIALGGSSNGSTLEGHSYTFMNAIWGKIADILMESKCMNPIIYIDELDKISKTEYGREILGILTHITDPSQNDEFQDKFFMGVKLDLSKILFIFSYNDATQIDPILLDRIHRVRFDNLTLAEKIVIAEKHILPDLNRLFGLGAETVAFDSGTLRHIVETYTREPGVRKLRELLFEIYAIINIDLLRVANGGAHAHAHAHAHADEKSKTEMDCAVLVTTESVDATFLRQCPRNHHSS